MKVEVMKGWPDKKGWMQNTNQFNKNFIRLVIF